ncbi:hypothetical protein GIB67_001172 [Kingdonia uniflora]|uniref:Uncharacterized protein n=1 Tax=Kingdonia uniflora TaxID=39325 RepID=A0A7J7LGF6_9MAGN|nr:hypothetical protein GIB67_001172 [Kingdonia uniflora]
MHIESPMSHALDSIVETEVSTPVTTVNDTFREQPHHTTEAPNLLNLTMRTNSNFPSSIFKIGESSTARDNVSHYYVEGQYSEVDEDECVNVNEAYLQLGCHFLDQMDGKIRVPNLDQLPNELQELYDGNKPRSRSFRKYIREYNAANVFTSLGVTMADRLILGREPSSFVIHGELYHRIGALLPNQGQEAIASTDHRRYNLPSTDEIVVILPGDGLKISSVRDIIVYLKAKQVLFKEKVHEYAEACESFEGKKTSRDVEIEQLKERLVFLEGENEEMKSTLAAYFPAVNCLKDNILSLEEHVLSHIEVKEDDENEKNEQNCQESCKKQTLNGPDAILDLQELQAIVKVSDNSSYDHVFGQRALTRYKLKLDIQDGGGFIKIIMFDSQFQMILPNKVTQTKDMMGKDSGNSKVTYYLEKILLWQKRVFQIRIDDVSIRKPDGTYRVYNVSTLLEEKKDKPEENSLEDELNSPKSSTMPVLEDVPTKEILKNDTTTAVSEIEPTNENPILQKHVNRELFSITEKSGTTALDNIEDVKDINDDTSSDGSTIMLKKMLRKKT